MRTKFAKWHNLREFRIGVFIPEDRTEGFQQKASVRIPATEESTRSGCRSQKSPAKYEKIASR